MRGVFENGRFKPFPARGNLSESWGYAVDEKEILAGGNIVPSQIAIRAQLRTNLFNKRRLLFKSELQFLEFMGMVDQDPDGGCWNWLGPNSGGYGVFHLDLEDARKVIAAHHFILDHVGRPRPEGLEVDHLCMNKSCVNPEHLEWVTHRENIKRAVRYKESWEAMADG